MPLNLNIVEQSIVPPFRQIINQIEESIRNGSLKSGEMLPSMSEMAESLGLSKETVKKSYLILRDQGVINSTRGVGYFIASPDSNRKKRVMLLFDRLSIVKEVIFDSFARPSESRLRSTSTCTTSRLSFWTTMYGNILTAMTGSSSPRISLLTARLSGKS